MPDHDQQPAAQPRNRIGELRKARHLTLAELARQVGTSAQQMGRLEAGHRRLTQDWMVQIASALGVAPADLLPAGAQASGTALPPFDAASTRYAVPAPVAFIDLPVRVTRRWDDGFLISPTAIEYALRPAPLVGVPEGFAFRVADGAMEPAYAEGDLLFADPRIAPREGLDVVLVAAVNYYQPVIARLGRVEAIGSETWQLRLLRTAETRTELRTDWPNVAVIVGCFRRI